MATTTRSGPRAGRREWLGLGILALPTVLVALDINVLFLALPTLTTDLGASATEQLWISDIYGFMVAGFVITMGTLGDRIGRRRLLLAGGTAFAAASGFAGYADSAVELIAARTVLGIAGATLMPSTLALITTMFRDARQRGTAIAVWATCQFSGAALGPVLGGLLLEHFWWGSVFLFAVPVMGILLLAGRWLPEYRDPDPKPLDLTSAALSLLAVLPTVYGIKHLAVTGGGVAGWLAMVIGAGFGIGFVRRQLLLPDPLLNLRLLRRGPVVMVLTALVIAGIAMAGTGLWVTQYLQSVLKFTPVAAALWFAPMGLGVAVGTLATPAITRWLPPGVAIPAGLTLSAAGAAMLTLVDASGGPVIAVVSVTVLALGTGPLFALGTGVVVGSVPQARAGSAAALSETSNYLGGNLGLALLGTVGAAVYQYQMATVPLPAEVPASARETVAGAAAVAGHLGSADAAALTLAAYRAFSDGLHVIGVVGAGLFLIIAVLLARRRNGYRGDG